jgi:hypothetical protein
MDGTKDNPATTSPLATTLERITDPEPFPEERMNRPGESGDSIR